MSQIIRHHINTLLPMMKAWARQAQVPQVLLLTGHEGIGKKQIAEHLTRWFFCDSSPFRKKQETDQIGFFTAPVTVETTETVSMAPCGNCSNCKKGPQTWMDFEEIAPDSASEDKDGRIKIDQFRGIKEKMGFGPSQNAFKVMVIDQAEKMTPQAANSVLKLLEEPPRGWIFILITRDATLLLPTIVSRCQQIRLQPIPKNIVQSILESKEIPPDRARLITLLSQGNLKTAEKLGNEKMWQQREVLFRFFSNPNTELSRLVDLASQTPMSIELLLEQLDLVFHDLISATLEPQKTVWLNEDGQKTLVTLEKRVSQHLGSSAMSRGFWIKCAELVSIARARSTAPVNKKILIQEVLFPFVEVLA